MSGLTVVGTNEIGTAKVGLSEALRPGSAAYRVASSKRLWLRILERWVRIE